MMGSLIGGWNSDREMKKAKASSGNATFLPESRLKSGLMGQCLVPIALLLHGETVGRLSPAVPMFGEFLMGFGMMFT